MTGNPLLTDLTRAGGFRGDRSRPQARFQPPATLTHKPYAMLRAMHRVARLATSAGHATADRISQCIAPTTTTSREPLADYPHCQPGTEGDGYSVIVATKRVSASQYQSSP